MSHWMIEVDGLEKSFGGVKVLDGVNLHVRKGDTCALIGVSGCGKTVLLKHLIGLLQPDAGRVVIDGHDLSTLDEDGLRTLRQHIGILFQGGALFDSMSVYENVAFPLREQLHLRREEIRARVISTLRLVGLEDSADLLPAELSGGMCKRLAFARTIVTQPELILYDDPTAGLDPIRTHAVAEEILLARSHLGATQVAVTADLPTAFRIADQIALMHSGVIVAQLPPREFQASTHPAVQSFLRRWIDLEASVRSGVSAH